MELPSPQAISLLLIFITLPLTTPYTVIMSDSGPPPDQPGSSIHARTDPREQQAVYDIMKATGNRWATDIPDVCRGRWHGIECILDKDNVYHVVSLSFGSLSDDTAFPTCDPTRSYISPSITNLPHLKSLFFYRCFNGNPHPIPGFLGLLGPTLQSLVLRDNGHIGPIPNELGSLTRLKIIDLHKNNLNGSIPASITWLPGLSSLDLSSNKLTGPIPPLTSSVLSVLDLNQNHLTGPIPSSLGSCKSLIKVDFNRNRLTGPIPDSISSLRSLILLDLSYNRITGPIPVSINGLTSLQALILKGNPMDSTTILEDGFNGLKELMILDLSDSNLHGSIPESIGHLTSLRVLHLDGNNFNGSIPSSFKELNNLSELRLNDNKLTGRVPIKKETVWRMKRKIRLYNNSGLCFDGANGFEDSFGSLFDSGIGYCEGTTDSSSKRNVQHLISSDFEKSLASSVHGGSNIARVLVQLTASSSLFLVLFVLL